MDSSLNTIGGESKLLVIGSHIVMRTKGLVEGTDMWPEIMWVALNLETLWLSL